MSILPARLRSNDLFSLLRRSWAISPALTIYGVAMIIVTILTVIGIFADPRIITGAPAWVKPAKFAISTCIYAFTLVWLVRFVQAAHPRLSSIINVVTAVIFTLEMAIVVLQAARGTTSHFNQTTPFDQTLYRTMAIGITFVWLATLLACILLLLQRFNSPVLAWTLRLSTVMALIGMGLGFLMTTNLSPDQLAMIATKHMPPSFGAHSVGVEDGGPSLPILGWSTVGGDLRIPHFFGLHGMQLLIIIGLLLIQFGPRWGLASRHQLALLWTAAVGYLGLTALLTWQALRAQSIIAPDALTLQAFAILISVVAVISIATLSHARLRRVL